MSFYIDTLQWSLYRKVSFARRVQIYTLQWSNYDRCVCNFFFFFTFTISFPYTKGNNNRRHWAVQLLVETGREGLTSPSMCRVASGRGQLWLSTTPFLLWHLAAFILLPTLSSTIHFTRARQLDGPVPQPKTVFSICHVSSLLISAVCF